MHNNNRTVILKCIVIRRALFLCIVESLVALKSSICLLQVADTDKNSSIVM